MSEPLLLAIDCSLRYCGAALSEGGKILASEALDLGRRQAEELPRMAERLLAGAGRSLKDVGRVAVTNGPGYFTGIRVGVSYAMALAYGLGVPIVPVSSLEMLAASAGGPVLAAVYAGRGAVYAASFGVADAPLPQGEYSVGETAAWLASHGVPAVSDDPERAAAPWARAVRPDPAKAAEIAWSREAVSPMALRAVYCRSPL